jgi:hypothetical protein
MPNQSNLKAALERDFAKLATARDELRVQIRLARADARDEWKRLEQTWRRVDEELKRVAERTKQPTKEVGSALRSLMKDLKQAYARIKSEIAEPPARVH